ncbi:MAG: ABC transporter substrate-binding protein, partial [Chitinophagales bacterium]
GTPVSVADIIFTFKVNKCPLTENPSQKPYVENLQTIIPDPVNPRKFTMVMKKPYLQNIAFTSNLPIMQQSFYDAAGLLNNYTFEQFDNSAFVNTADENIKEWFVDFNSGTYGNDLSKLNGSGAYKVTSWNRGQSLTLEKKLNHWTETLADKKPFQSAYPDKIIFKTITDVNAQTLELKSQDIDVSTWLSTQNLIELEQDSNFRQNYHYRYTRNFNFNYIGLNMKPDGVKRKKIFDDVNVRWATSYLIPIDDILQVVYSAKAEQWNAAIPPFKEGYNHDLPLIKYDPVKAKQLLTDAGWIDSNGDNILDKTIDGKNEKLKVELIFSMGGKFIEQMAEMVADALRKAGYEVTLLQLDLSTLAGKVSQHDFDMYMGAWAGSFLPEDYTQLWHTSSWASGGSNYTGFGTAESDALIDSIKATIDAAKRTPMVERLHKIIYEQQPYIMIFSSSRKNVVHKRFGNIFMTFEKPGVILNHLKVLPSGVQQTDIQ